MDTRQLRELACIILNPQEKYRDWFKEQEFPLIHKIILNKDDKLLEQELRDNPDTVHLKDALGRTALDWATALAQLRNMELLIAYGSHVNTMDTSGRTAVLHAVDSHSDKALRILLKAGANPNPNVPSGLFRSSPLISASFGGLVEMVRLLVHYGADVNACNPEGRTALHTVASRQNAECADVLLSSGADPVYVSCSGHSPISMAIIYNNHDVLKLFINKHGAIRQNQIQLLPLIAESADLKTMSLLISSRLLE